MDYIKLKTELDDDSKGLGYSGKTDQEVADLVNEIGLSKEQIDNNNITADAMYAALDMVEMATLATQDQKNRVNQLLLMGAIYPVKSMSNIRITITAEFATTPITMDAFMALTYRDASRAEILFGAGKSVGLIDVHIARRL